MLVNTFGKKINASSVVKDSAFYIEVAKFVQAYTVILNSPNDFLSEVGEQNIDESNDKLSWAQVVKIMTTCNFGFNETPTESDLLVYFNYAIEIGSISKKEKTFASVDDIADAQKNYYNFVDEATDRAETEFLKQHRISKIRAKEVAEIDAKLSSFVKQKWIAFSLSIVAVILFCLSVSGFFVSNFLVEFLGMIIPIWSRQYIGSIMLLIISIVMFCYCDKWHLNSKQEYLKLEHASLTIFARNDSNFIAEQILRQKLEALKLDLETIKKELNDESKTFDVKANIERLIESNAYYKKLYRDYVSSRSAESKIQDRQKTNDEEKAYVVDEKIFVGEQEPSQEIMLEGQFDDEAYNEKFEISKNKKSKDKNLDKKEELIEEKQEKELEENEIEKQQKQQTTELEVKSSEELQEEILEEEKIEEIEQKSEEILTKEQISDADVDLYLDYIRSLMGNGPENTL